jgi:hypothetical protein
MKRHFAPFALVLAVLLAAPLAAQDMGNLPVPGATYATGTVVSQSADSLIIRTDSGETRTFLIDAATVGVKPYAAGSRVRIDFVLDDQSRSIAKEIQGVSGDTAAASETETATAPAPAPLAEPMPESSAPSYETPAAESDTATLESDDELPATAGPLPLIALLGAGALGSGLVLRLRRRS